MVRVYYLAYAVTDLTFDRPEANNLSRETENLDFPLVRGMICFSRIEYCDSFRFYEYVLVLGFETNKMYTYVYVYLYFERQITYKAVRNVRIQSNKNMKKISLVVVEPISTRVL